ncbi:MAG: hypothetical protein QGI86_24865 [Candidatus Poribacteria bacterium]|nr:hypothetical protein [Candidatus Poribacteria bacterium]MDP6750895.1 hypothetical protein [Candidatus Poribacteria bacterium]MDP6999385.1 hypothetical protein [Candidatus Poribacteria bacterium]
MPQLVGSIVQYTAKHTINLLRPSGQPISIVGGIAGLIAFVFRLVTAWPYIIPASNTG